MTFTALSNGSLSGNRTGQGSQSGANRSWGLQGEETPEGNGTTLTFALDVQAVGVGVFLAVFILSAIVGNILVILSVACNRHLQTVTNYFIVNLAIADLLLSTTVLPFSATLEVLGFWVFGRIFCNIWAAVDVLCCSASIMSLCIISVDRYIGVKYSLKYPTIMTEKKAGVILVLVWLSSMVISIGPLLGWKEPPPPDDSICSITEEPGYALFSSLFSFYLPLMVILVMYFRIYVVARRTTRSLEAGVKKERNKSMEVVLRIHCRSVLEEPLSSTRSKGHNLRSSLSVRLLKFSREKKAAKTLAIVVGVFILCWFPFFFILPFEPVPFKSINDWALQIASSRRKTQEMLKLAAVAAQESIELQKEAEELERKINYLKKTFVKTTEDQNNSKMIEGKNQKSVEKPEKLKERIFEGREHPSLLNEKHQLYKPLHVPSIPRKLVQSVQSIRFSVQRTERGREEKEKPMELPVAASSSSSLAENSSQVVTDTAGTNNLQIAQVPAIASSENQMQFRLAIPSKQMTSNQQFESENAVIASQEAKCDEEAEDEPKDYSYIPQEINTNLKSNEDNPDTAEESSHFLRAPETPEFVGTADSKGKKTQFSKLPSFDFIHNLGSEEGTSKSPAFFSLMNFTQKSPGFNLFDSSVFGAENSSDETEEGYSVGNLNPLSPQKDIGSLFGKSESEEAFAFPFPSESTSHAFGDGKDDFSFPFAFGQDQRSSQSSPVKGFHSSLQNTKPFTFF